MRKTRSRSGGRKPPSLSGGKRQRAFTAAPGGIFLLDRDLNVKGSITFPGEGGDNSVVIRLSDSTLSAEDEEQIRRAKAAFSIGQ